MDKAQLRKDLVLVEERLAKGEHTMRRLLEIVDRRREKGQNTWSSVFLLSEFRKRQEAHVADRDRLLAKLARLT